MRVRKSDWKRDLRFWDPESGFIGGLIASLVLLALSALFLRVTL